MLWTVLNMTVGKIKFPFLVYFRNPFSFLSKINLEYMPVIVIFYVQYFLHVQIGASAPYFNLALILYWLSPDNSTFRHIMKSPTPIVVCKTVDRLV